MNKVIAVLDALRLADSTLDYATCLSDEFNAHIVATFLEDITYHAKPGTHDDEYIFTDWPEMDTVIKKEKEVRDLAKRQVQSKLDSKGVQYNIHTDKVIAIEALITESRYADMILIDGDEKFSNIDRSKPSHFLQNVLSESDCPVMVVPCKFNPIEKFVFAYDGSPASIYAIKQFSYLFPGIQNQDVEILMVTDDRHSNHFPHQHLLKELLKRKYMTVLQTVIKSIDVENSIIDHLSKDSKNCMLVLGAYQRSAFSRWLYQSLADALISGLNTPMFVAHK